MLGTKKLSMHGLLTSRITYAVLLALAAVTVVTTSTLLSMKTVTVFDGGAKPLVVKSYAKTVGDFMAKQNITVGEKDLISPPLATEMKSAQRISIVRAFPVTVNIADEPIQIQTTEKTISSVLEENGIQMDEMDLVSPSLDSVVKKNMEINITKVTEDMISVQEEIPFEKISTPNSELERGKTRIVTEGVPGTKELMYRVIYHNGEETNRELAGERIVTEPVNEVEEYGTQYQQISYRGGRVLRDTAAVEQPQSEFSGARSLICTATAYDLSYESCGKNPGDPYYGIAASGMKITRGIVAVDPRVIPMGSKLYIESLDSWPDYGYAIAGDKGGAIKGNKVDLFMESSSEVYSFGRRQVRVYILD